MILRSILILFTAALVQGCATASGTSQERLRTAGMRRCTARDVVDDQCVEHVSRAKEPDNTAKY